MRRSLVLFAFALASMGAASAQTGALAPGTTPAAAPVVNVDAVVAKVESPDRSIRVELRIFNGVFGRLIVDGQQTLGLSDLGLELAGEKFMDGKDTLVSQEQRAIDETWTPVTGKATNIRNQANETTLHLRTRWGTTTRDYDLVMRVSNDGVAWRYVLPKEDRREEATINKDFARLSIEGYTECWVGSDNPNSSQEWIFRRSVSQLFRGLAGMPVLLKSEKGLYLAFTEADVTNWAGSRLTQRSNGGGWNRPALSTWQFVPAVEDKDRPPVKVALPAQSPWRVVMIGRTPGDLIESNLIENLNPPSEIKDTSWIKPGIAAWDWWSGRSRMTTDDIKKFVQLAADMGWPYTLIDAGWYYHEDQADGDLLRVSAGLDMDEVRRFAQEKGVRLWLWMSWRDVMRNDAYKRAFPLFREWGIAGVKIDFMNREDQWMVDWYHLMFRETADNHLMLDLHGAYKPTGARRTWPNFVTQEGVLGNEYNRGGREDTARHNVTIPYTRGLLGPMDYTPGGFVNQTPAQFSPTEHGTTVPNTRGQELAKFVVFESPLQMACDHPDNYRDQPGADFLKVVKTSWDEVRWLSGEVGESVVLARRSGEEWFVGGMTNENARKVKVKLGFLKEGKRYRLTTWKDGPEAWLEATQLVKEEREVGAGDGMEVAMAPAGGFVMRLVPVGE